MKRLHRTLFGTLLLAALAAGWWLLGVDRGRTGVTPDGIVTTTPDSTDLAVDRRGASVDSLPTSETRERVAIEGVLPQSPRREYTLQSVIGLVPETAVAFTPDGKLRRVLQLGGASEVYIDLSPPFFIRLAGHVDALVEQEEGLVELEPELGLVLQSPGFEKAVRNVHFFWEDFDADARYGDSLASGFTGPDEFALAVSWSRMVEHFSWSPEVQFLTHDDRLAKAALTEDCVGIYHHAVRIAPGGEGRLRVSLHCEDDDRPDYELAAWGEVNTKTAVMDSQVFTWGYWHIQGWPGPRQIESGLGEVEFERLTIGHEYTITAKCRNCGNIGKEVVTLRSPEQRLELELVPGAVVVGSVEPGLWTKLSVNCRPGDEAGVFQEGYDRMWMGSLQTPVDAEGYFRLVLPDQVPPRSECCWPMPPRSLLTLSVPGCESIERWIHNGSRPPIDLGRLPFQLMAHQLVLAPGHGFSEESNDLTFHTCVEEHRQVVFSSERAKQASDGSLEIVIDEGDASVPLEQWKSTPPDCLVVNELNWDGIGFRLAGDRYERVPMRKIELIVDCRSIPTDNGRASLGWTWEGIDHDCGRVDAKHLGRETEWTIVVPEGARSIWWSAGRERPSEVNQGKSVPLTASLERFTIP